MLVLKIVLVVLVLGPLFIGPTVVYALVTRKRGWSEAGMWVAFGLLMPYMWLAVPVLFFRRNRPDPALSAQSRPPDITETMLRERVEGVRRVGIFFICAAIAVVALLGWNLNSEKPLGLVNPDMGSIINAISLASVLVAFWVSLGTYLLKAEVAWDPGKFMDAVDQARVGAPGRVAEASSMPARQHECKKCSREFPWNAGNPQELTRLEQLICVKEDLPFPLMKKITCPHCGTESLAREPGR